MLPGHETDRNLPLRKFFLALVDRAIELSRSDAPMRRLLNNFADETGVTYDAAGWRSLSRQMMFASEVNKDLSYGVLAVKHFVQFLEYATMHPDEVKAKGLTEEFRGSMEEALDLTAKLACYANPTVLETFDFDNRHMEPIGQRSEPTAH